METKVFEVITTQNGTYAFRYVKRLPVTLGTQLTISSRLEKHRYSLSSTFYLGKRGSYPRNHLLDDYCGTTVPASEKELLEELLNSNTFVTK